MKNRTILGIICIVLAVAVMFGVAPLVAKMSAGKITVIQVNKQIAQGKTVTADDIIEVEIGKQGVSESVIRDEEQIVGKYAKSDLYPEVNITAAMLSDTADSADDVFCTLDGNYTAVSISVPSFAAGLSGKLQNGDIVSVMVVDGSGTKTPAELTYVKVITTTTSSGTDEDELEPDEDGNYELPATITLLVTPEQAELLAGYEANAKMHLSLVYRGDEATAQKYLDKQNAVLNGGTADE